MKFRNYLETIAGIGIYPLISLIIFFVFFISLLVFVLRIDKKSLKQMESMPLHDGIIKKGVLSLSFFLLISSAAFAQETPEKLRAVSGTEILLFVLLALLFFTAVMVTILLVNALGVLKQVSKSRIPLEVQLKEKNWWEKFAGMSVSISDEKEILIEGHDYDGIQELDNRMPPWLQSLFLGTVVIAIAYAGYYYGGIGQLQQTELNEEIAQAEIEKKIYMEKVGASMDENTVTAITEAAVIGQGQTIFQDKCTACHGADGGGSVGPNLTDEYWLHGGGIKNLFKVIKYGVPEKGMISWEKQLSPGDIQKVASYVLSLKGTRPTSPKEPQGEIFEDEKMASN